MSITSLEAAREMVRQLGGKWHGRYGMAKCPAHADRRASLSITPGHRAVLYHCFAGCPRDAIIDALRRNRLHVATGAVQTGALPESRDLTPLVRETWSKGLPTAGTPAQLYLQRRRIAHSTIARYDPRAATYDSDRRIRLPALLLPIHDGHRLCALHRIFIDLDGQKATQITEPKRTLGDARGGAIKIGGITDGILNLAEGFEDAESAIVLQGLAGCWAVCGVERYQRLTIPDKVRRIIIYSQHGDAADKAIQRSWCHLTGEGRAVEVRMPPPGGDWNDALTGGLACREA